MPRLLTFLLRLLGIGRATSLALARCGAEVTAVTRTKADLDSLVQEVLTPWSRSNSSPIQNALLGLLSPSWHQFLA